MRRLAALSIPVALALMLAGGAIAKTTTQKLSGTISKLDAPAKTFTVKHADKETMFMLASDAKIMSGSKAESLDNLAVGQSVSVSYLNEGKNTHLAQRIDVAKAKASGHPATAAKPKTGSSESGS